MYYIRVEGVGFSGRNNPPLPPAMNTMNFRFSHATYEKAPTSQWRQCGAFPEDRINTQVIYRFALAQLKCIYYTR